MLEFELCEQYSKQQGGVSSTQGWILGVDQRRVGSGEGKLGKEMAGYSMPKVWALATAWMRLLTSSLP
jgi:hypothetical protein